MAPLRFLKVYSEILKLYHIHISRVLKWGTAKDRRNVYFKYYVVILMSGAENWTWAKEDEH